MAQAGQRADLVGAQVDGDDLAAGVEGGVDLVPVAYQVLGLAGDAEPPLLARTQVAYVHEEVPADVDGAAGHQQHALRALGARRQARLDQVGERGRAGAQVERPHAAAAGEAEEGVVAGERDPPGLVVLRRRSRHLGEGGVAGAVAVDRAVGAGGGVDGAVGGDRERVEAERAQRDVSGVGAVLAHVDQG